MPDTRPNGHVTWEITLTEEYEGTFTPEQMEAFGFAFINGTWVTDYGSDLDPEEELANAGWPGSLVDCQRQVTGVTNTDGEADDDD